MQQITVCLFCFIRVNVQPLFGRWTQYLLTVNLSGWKNIKDLLNSRYSKSLLQIRNLSLNEYYGPMHLYICVEFTLSICTLNMYIWNCQCSVCICVHLKIHVCMFNCLASKTHIADGIELALYIMMHSLLQPNILSMHICIYMSIKNRFKLCF